MHGANPLAALAAPGVLPGSGTAASETVAAVGLRMPHPAALHPAGACLSGDSLATTSSRMMAFFLVAQRPSDLSCAGAGQDGVGNGLHVSRVGAAAATEDGDLWVLCPQLHVIAG